MSESDILPANRSTTFPPTFYQLEEEPAQDNIQWEEADEKPTEDEREFASLDGEPAPGKRRKSKTLNAVVLMPDQSEMTFHCPNGKYTTADEMRNTVAELTGMQADSFKYFAIWIVSSSLQLQMKSYHLPFKVMKKWHELLAAYSSCDPYTELPVFYFRREAIVNAAMEQECTDPVANRLFFDELTYNVAYSFYPCDVEDAIYIAAINWHLEDPTDLWDLDQCLPPEHLSVKKKHWERRCAEEKEKLPSDTNQLIQLGLEFGRQWAYYGATFFMGEIEAPKVRWVIRERPDETVRVGVNQLGLHVINDKKNQVKLSLSYDQIRYNSYEDAPNDVDEENEEDEDPASQPDSCFLIEYNLAEEDPDSMVIWTPQATMIDTLVTRFVNEAEKFEDWIAAKSLKSEWIAPEHKEPKKKDGSEQGLGRRFSRFFRGDNGNKDGHFTLSRLKFMKSIKSGFKSTKKRPSSPDVGQNLAVQEHDF
eukprot:m.115094 g.115094  ORF g.115094 m.115094 type:complete len:478 (-) comp22962_c0_seq6:241-1674(-)